MVHTGVIDINPNPGYQYNFACHSHLIQLGSALRQGHMLLVETFEPLRPAAVLFVDTS